MQSTGGTGSSEGATDVLAQVARVVHLVTEHPTADVRRDQAFATDLGVDSLAMVEILAGVGRLLDVDIEDEAAKGFVRVHDLVEYVEARASERARRLP